jgi:hypothetical protein
MIWFILIYIITLILYGVFVYIDIDKGETLQRYFQNTEIMMIVSMVFTPIINTGFVILLFSTITFEKIWNKIKYWKK